MPVPERPKIYHIVHVDRLHSILNDSHLFCDAEIVRRQKPGTNIGMPTIKRRRLQTPVRSRPGLCVGECVPFYFCTRSVMLYLIHQANNPELHYTGGQGPIIHLEADLYETVRWAERNGLRWAFTLSNAGSTYFEDRADLSQLNEINWDAVQASYWQDCREPKQAEFLLETRFPWQLVTRIGVHSDIIKQQVEQLVGAFAHAPAIQEMRDWYYS